MGKLWEKRRKPVPLKYEQLLEHNGVENNGTRNGSVILKEQRVWSLQECLFAFENSLQQLKSRLQTEEYLVWDKDDQSALDFVTAVSNLRSQCFGIERKSKFDVKSMAGNIIPAISSTNSIVGGLICLQTLKILQNLDNLQEKNEGYREICKHVYLSKITLNRPNAISAYALDEVNPNCLVCSGRVPEVEISCSLEETSIMEFVEQILFNKLHFACPDIKLDGSSVIIWSKDDYDDSSEEEKKKIQEKNLLQFPYMKNRVRLLIDDLVQNHSIIVTLNDEKVNRYDNEGLFFKINLLNAENTAADSKKENSSQQNIPTNAPSTKEDERGNNDDYVTVESDEEMAETGEKRKLETENRDSSAVKKAKH